MNSVVTAGRRGPYRKGIETRARVVAAAIGIFGRYGYRGGTLQAVADETGITPGAIIRLFGSKQDLLLAVVQAWDDQVSDILRGEPQGLAYFAALQRVMALHVRNRGLLELHTTLGAEASDPNHPAHEYMAERYQRVRATVTEELLHAVQDGDLAPLDPARAAYEASCLIAVMDGLQVQWLVDPSVDLERAFAFHLDAMLGRLRPVDQTARSRTAMNGRPGSVSSNRPV